jgi:hypothetical protein
MPENFVFTTNEEFESVFLEAERLYKATGEVWCPYFQENIAFNSKGLKHLKFKSDGRSRAVHDQYARFKLLKFVPEIIKKSHTIQGIARTKRFEEQMTNSRRELILKEVNYYEFVAILEEIRMKVIVKEVVGGKKYFWSAIPFWKFDKNRHERILHGGEIEFD